MNHATAVLRLRGSPADRPGLECLVVDAVWAVSTTRQAVQHVHARVIQDRLHVTVFLLGLSQAETWATVTDLCRRTVSVSPLLSRLVQDEIATITLTLTPFAADSPHAG